MPSWLLVMDVDGTILTDTYTVLDEVREAVQRVRAQGVFATLATARAPQSVRHILQDIGGVDAAICFGGALTLKNDGGSLYGDDTGEHNAVPVAMVRDLVLQARTAGLSIAAYGARNVYVDRLNETLRHQFEKTGLASVEGDLLGVSEPVLKLLAIAEDRSLHALAGLRRTFGDALSCLYSHPNFLEINHKSVSKGAAVEGLRQSLGIARDNVIAIGDAENDLSMFAVAGMPIAMGNAIDRVKQSASWVTETNGKAGVAVALRRCETLWRS